MPAVWSEALKILQKNYANFLVISAFADVMHYKIGISGIYTEKFILLCLISDQGRKILRDGMVGIYRGMQPRNEFMERKKNLL